MSATVVRVGGGTVHVLATVQGLASEAERFRRAFSDVSPRVLALGASVEAVAGLRHHLAERERRAALPARDEPEPREVRHHKDGTLVEEDVDDEYEYDAAELLTDAEVAYGVALQRFGKVLLPPRELLAAVALARDEDVPLFGVDLTEEEYGEVFARHVSAWSLLRYTRRSRRLERRPPEASSAREFAIEWDAALREVKGIDAVERERERRMAENARRLAREHGNVLLVVEAAREAGVLAALTSV